jgi:hypothetical protein
MTTSGWRQLHYHTRRCVFLLQNIDILLIFFQLFLGRNLNEDVGTIPQSDLSPDRHHTKHFEVLPLIRIYVEAPHVIHVLEAGQICVRNVELKLVFKHLGGILNQDASKNVQVVACLHTF